MGCYAKLMRVSCAPYDRWKQRQEWERVSQSLEALGQIMSALNRRYGDQPIEQGGDDKARPVYSAQLMLPPRLLRIAACYSSTCIGASTSSLLVLQFVSCVACRG